MFDNIWHHNHHNIITISSQYHPNIITCFVFSFSDERLGSVMFSWTSWSCGDWARLQGLPVLLRRGFFGFDIFHGSVTCCDMWWLRHIRQKESRRAVYFGPFGVSQFPSWHAVRFLVLHFSTMQLWPCKSLSVMEKYGYKRHQKLQDLGFTQIWLGEVWHWKQHCLQPEQNH
jgi:hypothetical protein